TRRAPVVQLVAACAADADAAAVRFDDAGDDVEQRALSGAGSAEQADDRMFLDREIDVPQHFEACAVRARKAFADFREADRQSIVRARRGRRSLFAGWHHASASFFQRNRCRSSGDSTPISRAAIKTTIVSVHANT